MVESERASKSRLNNTIKFIVLNVNILYFLIGFFFIGLALYLWFANWGNLDPGFFLGSGLICALFGIAVTLVSCLAGQGIKYQTYKQGFWTGRKIVGIYLVILVGMLIGEIYLLSTSLSAVEAFKDNYDLLVEDPSSDPPYANLEATISEKFNKFFFGAGSSCSASLYLWFWNWVDNNCPSGMSQLSCQGCYSYSVTMCQADENSCYATSNGDGPYCPYTLCRTGILHYFQWRILPFSYGVLAFACFQCVLILLNLMIFCFHPRDDSTRMVEKAGTVSYAR